eukprot:COSAG01_NODE_446_length_16939_cov_19.753518_1_plen_247_part_00
MSVAEAVEFMCDPHVQATPVHMQLGYCRDCLGLSERDAQRALSIAQQQLQEAAGAGVPAPAQPPPPPPPQQAKAQAHQREHGTGQPPSDNPRQQEQQHLQQQASQQVAVAPVPAHRSLGADGSSHRSAHAPQQPSYVGHLWGQRPQPARRYARSRGKPQPQRAENAATLLGAGGAFDDAGLRSAQPRLRELREEALASADTTTYGRKKVPLFVKVGRSNLFLHPRRVYVQVHGGLIVFAAPRVHFI